MSDLIDRQAVIKLVENSIYDLSESIEDTWAMVADVEALPSVQQWIPCSEGLPEHSERYLVSVLDGIVRRTTVAPYHPQSRTWTLTGRMAYWKVIAWMPLPEPYKEET